MFARKHSISEVPLSKGETPETPKTVSSQYMNLVLGPGHHFFWSGGQTVSGASSRAEDAELELCHPECRLCTELSAKETSKSVSVGGPTFSHERVSTAQLGGASKLLYSEGCKWGTCFTCPDPNFGTHAAFETRWAVQNADTGGHQKKMQYPLALPQPRPGVSSLSTSSLCPRSEASARAARAQREQQLEGLEQSASRGRGLSAKDEKALELAAARADDAAADAQHVAQLEAAEHRARQGLFEVPPRYRAAMGLSETQTQCTVALEQEVRQFRLHLARYSGGCSLFE